MPSWVDALESWWYIPRGSSRQHGLAEYKQKKGVQYGHFGTVRVLGKSG